MNGSFVLKGAQDSLCNEEPRFGHESEWRLPANTPHRPLEKRACQYLSSAENCKASIATNHVSTGVFSWRRTGQPSGHWTPIPRRCRRGIGSGRHHNSGEEMDSCECGARYEGGDAVRATQATRMKIRPQLSAIGSIQRAELPSLPSLPAGIVDKGICRCPSSAPVATKSIRAKKWIATNAELDLKEMPRPEQRR